MQQRVWLNGNAKATIAARRHYAARAEALAKPACVSEI